MCLVSGLAQPLAPESLLGPPADHSQKEPHPVFTTSYFEVIIDATLQLGSLTN
jgi:hypothetical protein